MMGQYYLLPIIILLTILYLLSYYLYLDKSISLSVHKLIWNVVLIVGSLVVGGIGIIMLIFVNLNLLPIDGNLLFWHVEAGILTATTGIFHVQMYWERFRGYF